MSSSITFTGLNPGGQLVFTPTQGTTDFGTDIGSLPDLDPRFPLVSGLRNLGEAIARRLETPRGGLFYAPDYGTDVRGMLNDALDATGVGAFKLQQAIEAEAEKDERVQSASASVVFDSSSSTLTITLDIETASGPFALILAVTAVSVTLLSAQ